MDDCRRTVISASTRVTGSRNFPILAYITRMSSKEREILEKQRQLAARLQKAAPPSSTSTSIRSASSSFKPPPPPATSSSSTNGGAKKKKSLASSKNVIDLTKPPTTAARKRPSTASASASSSLMKTTKATPAAAAAKTTTAGQVGAPSSSSSFKRPSKKRAANSSGAIAVAHLASVRANRTASAAKVTPSEGETTSATPSKNKKPSPRVQRKSIVKHQQGPAAPSLAKLVANVKSSSSATDAAAASLNSAEAVNALPTVQPDDFWKHLREWDFCAQLASLMKQQQQQQQDAQSSSSACDSTAQLQPKTKPLPNIFLNARHYVAAWAPLCLAECRAQLIQEATAGANNNSRPLLVQVESTTLHRERNLAKSISSDGACPWLLDGTETGRHVLIRTLPDQQVPKNDLSFFANDVVLLLLPKYEHVLEELLSSNNKTALVAAKRDDSYYSNCGLIGHVESSKSGVNGLILKVSKRKWASLGTKKMFLIKLGSNVTALREFTALCRLDNTPMKRFLLGQHLEQLEHRRKLSRHQSSEQLLNQMGGSQALGPGFIDYARQKFNASQLTAIAASANEYGEGGFTLIKGPPGTGKTTTLVAVLNSLHIRQYNKYYEEVRRIAALQTGARQSALEMARKAMPRLLVCAPSNAAVDNIILKIMEDGFVDGQGRRYNPSMIRVGVGQGAAVKPVSLETAVDNIFSEHMMDAAQLDSSIAGYRLELSRITSDIASLRRRAYAIRTASRWPLSKDWEIRIDQDTFDETGRVYFVNHKDKTTTYEVPPPPEPGETQFEAKAMPEYKAFMSRIVKLVENYFSVKRNLERCTIVKGATALGANHFEIQRDLEMHILNSVHIVMTTLGTAGSRTLESVDKFEVVVVDEAAQSVEPSALPALQLGSRHAVLVGDPQQLPATIFNVSGKNSKYDRSLFQRLEEAGQPVYMLNEQYRMHPKISHFPRHIFYGGSLLDGPNVRNADYGNPLRGIVCRNVPLFQPFTVLDLDSKEERGGTSLSNFAEAQLAVFLYQQLKSLSRGLSTKTKVAVITPYAQQSKLLRRLFSDALGPRFADSVEVNTVDAFQGREANVVIFSAVRAAGSRGIGFLADVRRMNVALTRAKFFLFVIARCESIVINPYWNDLVQHARETGAVVRVPLIGSGKNVSFGTVSSWKEESTSSTKPVPQLVDPRKRKRRPDAA